MGTNVVCVSGLLEWNDRTGEDYRRSAEAMNALGRRFRNEGLSLQYHNHDFEFDLVEDDVTGFDILLSNVDYEAVSLCFDAGWATRAGQNPVEFILRHQEIIRTIHLRDFQDGTSVSLGQGDLDLNSTLEILTKLTKLGAVMVEEDPGTSDPVGDMIKSRTYLVEAMKL